MSHIGKLSRGLKWWKNNRDLDGVLKDFIKNDYHKMLDVNYFLDYVKNKNKDAVELALYQVYLLEKAEGGKNSQLFRDLVKKIKDGDFPISKKKNKPKEKE